MSIKINDFSPWKLVSDYITPKVDRHIVVGGSDSGQSLLASGIILNNDAGNSALDDIQIKGATETHLFFADVSLDRIGINNDTPLTALDVSGTITATGLDINGDTDISGDDNSNSISI